MLRLTTTAGVTVSYERYGSGPPLILVHGGFSDHDSNWAFVKPQWERQFTVHAVARRGRGQTDATEGHSVEDEGRDAAAVIHAIQEPVFLLGHSYGAQVAMAAAAIEAGRVRKLVLYEPPWPHVFPKPVVVRLEAFAQVKDWESFAVTFFHEVLAVPRNELDALRTTAHWPPIIADSEATLGDLRALLRYEFTAERFRALRMPVLLQIGTESPRELYVTDALAAVLPDVRIEALPGQAHEGMTTAPEMYAEAVSRFLLA
jgi:pimeloyl-ACP methyl ester carboxylesterase